MLKQNKIYICILGITLLSSSCNDIDNDYQEPLQLVTVPDNFPNFIDSETNPLSQDGITLGKKLFFDKRLSGNNKVSCASCHLPELAFSDAQITSNQGISGNRLLRNSPALMNLAWSNNGLFWDGGSTNLESQAFAPLAHKDEMLQNLEQLILELNSITEYPPLFQKAFNQKITQANIVKAIAQFERTLISGNSKYDKYLRNESGGKLTETEIDGLKLAKKLCFSCHATPLLTDNDYHNNGLNSTFNDDSNDGILQGRFRVTNNTNDLGKFKTPTLRNIEKTSPYMHDGRFGTLEAVLDHYANGVENSTTLDPVLKQNGKIGISLSVQEKEQLIAFLKTLTDYEFLTDKRFSEF